MTDISDKQIEALWWEHRHYKPFARAILALASEARAAPSQAVAWHIDTHGVASVALEKSDLGLLAERYARPLGFIDAVPAPDGWKLVPIEPDGRMWGVGRAEFVRAAQQYEDARSAEKASIIGDVAGSDIYRAMLRASPPPVTAAREQVCDWPACAVHHPCTKTCTRDEASATGAELPTLDRATLERLAQAWGYTVEEAAANYEQLAEILATPTSAPVQAEPDLRYILQKMVTWYAAHGTLHADWVMGAAERALGASPSAQEPTP
jgi:hypothetical protein